MDDVPAHTLGRVAANGIELTYQTRHLVHRQLAGFLAARRGLLAAAASSFPDRLRSGSAAGCGQPLEQLTAVLEVLEDLDSREDQVMALLAELAELGCADPTVTARCQIRLRRGARLRRGMLAGRPATQGDPG